MNTKIIEFTLPKSLPHCPPLSSHKQTKIITKHFTNAAVYLPRTELSLFSWLIYQSGADNSFTYSTHLLNKYKQYLIHLSVEYNIDLPTSIQTLRKHMISLIERGYIIPCGGKHYLNPMFVISKGINKKRYKDFVNNYQTTPPDNCCNILKPLLNLEV